MKTWAPLWSCIVDSSIWDEQDSVCKIFLTMLALKDADHIYRGTAYNLARQSRKTEVEVLDALRILSSPDTMRVEAQDFNGRRVQAVEEGWLILNGDKYRSQVQLEMKRARNRRGQAAHRERQKISNPDPEQARMNKHIKACEDGNFAEADRIVAPEYGKDSPAGSPADSPLSPLTCSTPSPSAAISQETPRDAP